jgi:hypothetical protein
MFRRRAMSHRTYLSRGALLLRAAFAQPTEPLNQSAVALQLDVTQGAVSSWVTGRARPSADAIVELEWLFKIPDHTWFEPPVSEVAAPLKEVA